MGTARMLDLTVSFFKMPGSIGLQPGSLAIVSSSYQYIINTVYPLPTT
jgi:hypothetical protein